MDQLVPELTGARRALVLITFALGATPAVLREFYEWLRYHGQGPPLVGYNDTILDLLMGCMKFAGGRRRVSVVVHCRGWATRRR